jgi:hypothetical protein
MMLCVLLVPGITGAITVGVEEIEPWILKGEGPLYRMHRGGAGSDAHTITDVLVVGTTGANNLINGLKDHFSVVDYFDGTSSTPSLETLQKYDAMVTYSGWGWYHDYVAFGNVAADYADEGGGVVLTQLNHYDGTNYYLGGRMLDEPYMTINRGSSNLAVELGDHDPDHPIMEDVSSVYGTLNINNTTPYETATWVATWTVQLPGVYVSSNEKVVGINMYVSDQASNSGDWIQLIANALDYAAAGAGVSCYFVDPPAEVSVGERPEVRKVYVNGTDAEVTFTGDFVIYMRERPVRTIRHAPVTVGAQSEVTVDYVSPYKVPGVAKNLDFTVCNEGMAGGMDYSCCFDTHVNP